MSTAPGRLLRLTLQFYLNQNSDSEDREKFAREYFAKVAALHAKNGIEIYQQVYTPVSYRAALEEMNQRNNCGWAIDANHDVTVEFYFRNSAELNKVNSDPEFQALQVTEGSYVNLFHTVVTLSWVETYVDNHQVVIFDGNGNSLYPPWSELSDLSTAFPTRPAEGAKYSMRDKEKEQALK